MLILLLVVLVLLLVLLVDEEMVVIPKDDWKLDVVGGGVVVFIVEWVLWYYINDGRVIQQSTSVHGEDWIVTRPSFYPCELIPTPT